eukprot:1157701-Pelagomonas_calceolata.AAC.2
MLGTQYPTAPLAHHSHGRPGPLPQLPTGLLACLGRAALHKGCSPKSGPLHDIARQSVKRKKVQSQGFYTQCVRVLSHCLSARVSACSGEHPLRYAVSGKDKRTQVEYGHSLGGKHGRRLAWEHFCKCAKHRRTLLRRQPQPPYQLPKSDTLYYRAIGYSQLLPEHRHIRVTVHTICLGVDGVIYTP